MNLLHEIEDAERVLLVDAIDGGEPPGTTIVLHRQDLPRFFAMKLSPHQIDLKEVLAVAELRGTLPANTVAMGLQPQRVELSTELTPVVQDGISSLLARIIEQLEDWGHRADPLN